MDKSSGGGVESRALPGPSEAKSIKSSGNVFADLGLPNAPELLAQSDSEIAKKKRAPRGTFDRNAYQREYMRKRRKAEQSKKP